MPSIALIGDVLVDRFFFGKAKGLSPEAPIVTIEVSRIEDHLGGAGNVLLNMAALKDLYFQDTEVFFFGYVSSWLEGLITDANIGTSGVVRNINQPPTIKNRVVTEDPYQQLIRFDEDHNVVYSEVEDKICSRIKTHAEENGSFDVGIVSDYNHGAVTRRLISALGGCCKTVVADPKNDDPSFYEGVDILTPNLTEFRDMMGNGDEKALLSALSKKLWSAGGTVVLKKGAAGCLLCQPNGNVDPSLHNGEWSEFHDFPTHKTDREIVDVTGAGDTFLATFAMCLANNFELREAILRANMMAGISVTSKRTFKPDVSHMEAVFGEK